MRSIAATSVLSLAFMAAACQTPLSPGPESGALASGGPLSSEGVQTRATGGGHYTIPGDIELEFAFSALLLPNGRAEGNFHHRGQAEGALIDFTAEITCLSVDSANHRAWLGGVITKNSSTHPDFMTAVHQVGHDIWFRVQDNDAVEPSTTPDVTTIVGFETEAIPSSIFYCTTQPWRSTNVWPVQGNLTVFP
jgi:hypothetical protein